MIHFPTTNSPFSNLVDPSAGGGHLCGGKYFSSAGRTGFPPTTGARNQTFPKTNCPPNRESLLFSPTQGSLPPPKPKQEPSRREWRWRPPCKTAIVDDPPTIPPRSWTNARRAIRRFGHLRFGAMLPAALRLAPFPIWPSLLWASLFRDPLAPPSSLPLLKQKILRKPIATVAVGVTFLPR